MLFNEIANSSPIRSHSQSTSSHTATSQHSKSVGGSGCMPTINHVHVESRKGVSQHSSSRSDGGSGYVPSITQLHETLSNSAVSQHSKPVGG